MKNILDIKNIIRNNFRSKRKKITPEKRIIYSKNILKIILNSNKIFISKRIGIFYPCDNEINTIPIIKFLWKLNKKIYLPSLNFFKKNLYFIRYKKNTKLNKNKINIYEPYLNKNKIISINKLDLLFVPLIAFDYYGNRLGFGGGFYDKILKEFYIEKKQIYPIGLAYNFQFTLEKLPVCKLDVSLPEIITDNHH